ncbi:hypothetical protein BKA62DRAFT_694562 [Auriculariales sp. MPI-PUGE-AT-0066]|nr:hypothetical protein BKA62DRAFT_694562 [Auriculariales sp. MPI-PUGE-AT-0066]
MTLLYVTGTFMLKMLTNLRYMDHATRPKLSSARLSMTFPVTSLNNVQDKECQSYNHQIAPSRCVKGTSITVHPDHLVKTLPPTMNIRLQPLSGPSRETGSSVTAWPAISVFSAPVAVETTLLSMPTFSIAVVGAAGCGKSTVIMNALARDGLIESTEEICIGPAAVSRCIEVISRTGITSPSSRGYEASVVVYEVDTSSLGYRSLGVWPIGMPIVDGVLICYDASDATTFNDVPALLEGFQAAHLPTVLLGCKSDLPRQVSPDHASDQAARNGAGLIEVSLRSERERKKMRKAFSWMCKSISRVATIF